MDRVRQRRRWPQRYSRAQNGGPAGISFAEFDGGSGNEFALASEQARAWVFADECARAGGLLFLRRDDGKIGAMDRERNGGEDGRLSASRAGAVEEF